MKQANIYKILEKTLAKKDKYFDGEQKVILRNTISEDAVDFDEGLLTMLLAEEKLKEHFFKKVGKATVFDKDKFLTFVNNKNFLPDSYTKFTQNIGLTTDDDKFIKSSGKVVLNWPYKDCILEGGQTKEEKGRNEIFFNEILEKDEIDALLRPKAFTKFKKYTGKAGTGKIKEEKVKEFSRNEKGVIKDNLIIKGNNLLALHSLKEEFAGKVKLIYIDPPYNTGNDGFKYNDNFNHSTWLTFMKNRLEIARELLSDDGVIFVQCDYRENAYLKILMDEIFGRDKLVNEITWQKYGGVKNQATKKLTTQQETILFYSRTDNYSLSMVYNPLNQKYIKAEYKYTDKDGRKYAKLRGRNYQGGDKKTKIKYLDENLGSPITTLWSEEKLRLNTSDAEKIENFVGQKPEALLQRILEISTKENDIILDFFAGSGTTGAVAHKMNRQYILIEQMDYIKDLPEARIKKVIEGEQGGISKSVNWKGGGEFVYMEMREFNQEFLNQVKKAKSKAKLKKIFKAMKEKAFLSYRFSEKEFTKKIDEFDSLSLEDQKLVLDELLDKNQMYLPHTEIRDITYKVSKEDIEINESFYGKK